MLTKKPKALAIMLMLTLTVSMLAACAPSQPAQSQAPSESAVASSAAPASSEAASPAASEAAPAGNSLEAVYAGMKTDQQYVNIDEIKFNKPDKEFTVGLAMLNVNTGFFKALADGTKEELEKNGVKALMADCESDATKQVSQIENFITQGVDAIIINPADPQAAVNIALNKAYDAGIPVLAVDVPPDAGAKYMSVIATDAYQLGYLVGEKIATDLLAGTPEGEIEFGIIGGTEGNPIAAARNQAVRDAVKAVDKDGRLKEVSFLYAGAYSEESGLKTAENMLVANPNIKGIFGTCDAHIVGATAAAKRQGLDSQIIMGAVDGSKPALEIMKAGGPIKALGLNSPFMVGQAAARSTIAFLNDGTVPSTRLLVMQPELVTPENVDKYYDPNSAF